MSRSLNLLIGLLLVYVVGMLAPIVPTGKPTTALRFGFLDIGQGDAILIQTPDGYNALIDTGANIGRLRQELARFLPMPMRLDLLVLTHPDLDHFGAAEELVFSSEVGVVMTVDTAKSDWRLQGLNAAILQRIGGIMYINDNHDFRLGCCTEFDVLWPGDNLITKRETEVNEVSVAFVVKYNKFRAFLGGDLGSEAELQALHNCDPTLCEVYLHKLGHHGSKYSSSLDVLKATQPRLAVVSAGLGNLYGHPHQDVLQRLSDLNVEVWRTDLQGTIYLVTDGLSFVSVESLKSLEKKELKI